MQATLMTRQPAPTLACAGVRLRRCVRANAFGNALGSSVVGMATQGSQQEVRLQGAGPYSAMNYANQMDAQSDSTYWSRQVSGGGGRWDDAMPRSGGQRYADVYGGEATQAGLPAGWKMNNGRMVAPDGTDMGPLRGGGRGIVNINIRDGQSPSVRPISDPSYSAAEARRFTNYPNLRDTGNFPDLLEDIQAAYPDRFGPATAFVVEPSGLEPIGSGSIKAVEPSGWEKLWGDPNVQHVMGNTITGKVVGGLANMIGTGVSAFRADGYNPATLRNVYGVEKQRALQDTVIGVATLPIGMGSMAGIRGASVNEAALLQSMRRSELNAKFGRTGDLNRDINYRGVIEKIRENADLSADYALGTPRTYGRFGTKAHGEFERLNDLTNQRIVGTDYSLLSEQFRGPSIGGGPGLVTSRRATGSMGLDVQVQYQGVPQIGFDLKTGRGWNLKTFNEVQQRFGIPVHELHPK